MSAVTRRDFLKYAGLAAVGPALPGRIRAGWGPNRGNLQDFPETGPAGLGRVTAVGVSIYEKPEAGATRIARLAHDEVITIYAEVEGDRLYPHNAMWFQTLDGYVYSSYVQPVENAPQVPEQSLPETGALVEVSVPYVNSRGEPSMDAWRSYRLYYSTVYRAMSVTVDETGQAWYGLDDAGGFRPTRFVPAETMRIIRPEDLAPLSPGAEKYIHVDLTKQLLEAYEGTRKVFEARVCSGAWVKVDDEWQDNRTVPGKYYVLRKRPSSHMRGGTEGKADYYDLPGVPFCTYFTWSAVAVHGAYWHHDYGRPRSHGCLNVLPSHARWVYRWAEPVIGYADERVEVKDKVLQRATPIEVVS